MHGYKIARVEQTETPDALKERKNITKGKKPQMVNREVCSVMSRGTRTFCFLDDDRIFDGGRDGTGQGGGLESLGPLLVIWEVLRNGDDDGEGNDGDDDAPRAVCEYGVAVVTVGQFADDVLRSRLVTLLANFGPSEVSFGSILMGRCVRSMRGGTPLPTVRFIKRLPCRHLQR